ncbi:MAG: hypothetical protein KIS81_11990 [Maricaulaceae bacterium]|nr:hypothetical protein [Maricaulaceae bacterium]
MDKSSAEPLSIITRGPNGILSNCSIWVRGENFYGGTKHGEFPFLIIGFDTEYKTPADPIDREGLSQGLGRNTILSYQVHCKLFDPDYPDCAEWGGICFPKDGSLESRLSLTDVLTFAIWRGIETKAVKAVPQIIYLVGHFTRADIPSLSDFQSLTHMMSSIRNTFLSINGDISVEMPCADGGMIPLKVLLRDTMLLTPSASKGLKALGELVGQQKIALDPDPAKDQFYKENMDILLEENPDLFDRYALNDAVICVRYAERLIQQTESLLGKPKLPATLTSIGVDLLWKKWELSGKSYPLEILGKEEVRERKYNKRLGYYEERKRVVDLQEVSWHEQQATECYHGGRNEQFWFGPAFEDDWIDYDLSSAYPTAMGLIRKPDWKRAFVTTRISKFQPDVLGVANVEFEFPEHVRFPTLPVRTDNGLIFPRKGVSDCASPEIVLAQALGAKLKIRHGVVVPYSSDEAVFGDFIADCIRQRSSFPKGSLGNLFWKELSNASYGKTAQGLREKRVFDLRDRTTKPLPPSKITNPYFAAFITSFVRAVLGEIMNGLPHSCCVFSCTTDGFLTNATQREMDHATQGRLVALYSQGRQKLTGDPTVLEIKHRVRQPLGWRTRGQATLKPGTVPDAGNANFVLAKGGIHLPEYIEDTALENSKIVNLFLNRSPDDKITFRHKTGVRDIVTFDADLVDKSLTRRLSMEFDWKRKPNAAVQCASPNHVAFSTKPWDTVDEFILMRQYWEDFAIKSPFCLKSIADYRQFAIYVMTHSTLGKADSKYLRRDGGDLKRLRQSLGAAWRHSKAGLTWQQHQISNGKFAEILTEAGIPCNRADIENASRKPFAPKKSPPTPDVYEALTKLALQFPTLEVDAFIANNNGAIDLVSTINSPCPFTSRL